jgi:hypothetical protein
MLHTDYTLRVPAIRRKLHRNIVVLESLLRANARFLDRAQESECRYGLMRLYDLDCRLENRMRGIARPTRR